VAAAEFAPVAVLFTPAAVAPSRCGHEVWPRNCADAVPGAAIRPNTTRAARLHVGLSESAFLEVFHAMPSLAQVVRIDLP